MVAIYWNKCVFSKKLKMVYTSYANTNSVVDRAVKNVFNWFSVLWCTMAGIGHITVVFYDFLGKEVFNFLGWEWWN